MNKWQRIPGFAKKIIYFVCCFIVIATAARLWIADSLQILVNVVYPIITIVGTVVVWAVARTKKRRPLRNQADKTYAVFSIMMLWGILYFLSGLISTYVKNSLTSSILSVLMNIWIYMIPALALEILRYNLIKILGRKSVNLLPLLALIFTLLTLVTYRLPTMQNGGEVLEYVMEYIIPLIFSNIVLTYLAWTAGLPAMLIYQFMNILLTVFLPLIPKYDWYATSMTSVIVSLVIFYVIDSMRQDKKKKHVYYSSRLTAQIQTAIPIIILIALTLFVSGVLSYRPVAIMSNSMKPIFSRGDMVIVERTTPEMDISIGDIVEYSVGGKLVTHRVVEIVNPHHKRDVRYITKGDNSPAVDDSPVAPSQLKSIVRAKIPWIGYPTVILYESIGKARGGAH